MCGTALTLAREGGRDQFVFHAVLPTHELGDTHLVALALQVQAPQHVGELAAHLPRVQRVPPKLRQGGFGQCFRFARSELGRQFGLTTRHQKHQLGFFGQSKLDGVVTGRVTGMERRHHIHTAGQKSTAAGCFGADVQKIHALEVQFLGQGLGVFHQLQTGFNANDLQRNGRTLTTKLLMQHEAQIGLAATVVDQHQGLWESVRRSACRHVCRGVWYGRPLQRRPARASPALAQWLGHQLNQMIDLL